MSQKTNYWFGGNVPLRVFWATVYLAMTLSTLYMVYSYWIKLLTSPVVTSLESTVYPVSETPFPGLAFCNLNKISRKRADRLAHQIAEQTGSNHSFLMGLFNLLGNLIDSEYDDKRKDDLFAFQAILDSVKLSAVTVFKELTVPCEDFMKTCRWKNKNVNCSDVFQLRLTYEGYCCTFNYVKNTSEWWMDAPRDPLRGRADLSWGLSVMIDNNIDDYYYTVLSSLGVKVQVFIPTDFPDKASGSLIENLVEIGSENFMELVPTTWTSVKEVITYPVSTRKCLFEVEQLTQFGLYSQSDCLVDCRVNSLLLLCSCIPFYIPITDKPVCTLTELPCLSKNKNKWLSQAPTTNVHIKENEYGLKCRKTCEAACQGTLYDVSTSTVPVQNPKWKNYTSIHVYYSNRYSNLFKQDVVYYWYEILGNYGGLFGIMLGLSFVHLLKVLGYVLKGLRTLLEPNKT